MGKSFQVVGLILNYCDATRTANCIRSLHDNGVEHIFVWDNSEDGGKSARLLKKEFPLDERLDVIISPYNTGFSLGINRGIDYIKSAIPHALVLIINNDAILPQQAMNKLVVMFENSHEVVIAHPSLRQKGKIISKGNYNKWLATITLHPYLGTFPYPSGCCLLVSLEKLTTKLFDESFFMYGEDIELGFRFPASGIVHVPEVVVMHEGSVSSKLGSIFYESRMVAAHWLLAQKLACHSSEKFILYLLRFLLLPMRALVRALRFSSWIPLKALYEGWRIAHGHDPLINKRFPWR